MDSRTMLRIMRDISDKEEGKRTNMLFEIYKENQAHITFNRPKIMNAFSLDMYFTFVQYIQKANEMNEIKYIVLKGAGGNFSSGNDLNNFSREEPSKYDIKLVYQATADILQSLTQIIMKSKKPIFALVEGRVVGFAFTQLALYDRVFSTKDAVFIAPLVKIGQGPQMASSYLFPKIFGQNLAEDILIKGKKMKPQELQKYNFLTCHQNIKDANTALQEHIEEIQKLDWASYLEARKLLRQYDKEPILKANIVECENLVQRWINPDLPMIILKHMSQRKQNPKL